MSTNKVTHLSQHLHDGTRWMIEQMLVDVLSEVKEHRRMPAKAIVLFLADSGGKYEVGSLRLAFLCLKSFRSLRLQKRNAY